MRLAVIGRDERESVASGLVRGALSAGIDARHFPAPPPLVRFRRLGLLRRIGLDWMWLIPHLMRLARQVQAIRPDAVLVVKALGFRPYLLRRFARAVGAPVWNFYPDIPYDPADSLFRVVNNLAAYDGVFIWSTSLAERLRADGLSRVELLRFAYDPELYFPARAAVDEDIEVSFVGTWHPDREAIVTAIGGLQTGLVAGPGWEAANTLPPGWRREPGRVTPGRARELYWRSKVVLNLLHPLSVPGYNMRTFEVPASGSAMVATGTPDHEELFASGHEVVLFDSPAEARDIVRDLLNDDEKRTALAANGLARVGQETYEARARQLWARVG